MDINFRLSYLSNNGFVDLFPKTNTLGIIDTEQSLSFASASVQIPAYSGQTQTIPLSIFDSVKGTNLLLDTDASGMGKVSAEYDRYITSPVDGVNAAAEFATIENSPCGTQNLFRVKILTAQPNSGTTVAGLRFYNHTGPMPLGISFIPGEQYTMSCYARKTSGAPKINMTMWGLTALGWQDVPEEWTKFSLTFKATEAFNTTTTAWAVFSAHKSYVGTLEMTGFKIERGNKATDWTPAPEDSWVEMVLVGDTEQEQKDYSTITQFQVFNNQLVITRLNQMPTNSIEVKLLFYIRGGIEYG